MITGKFNKLMETFFMAEAGAYTTFTEWEMDKGTFNVKKDIRNILIEKIGKSKETLIN